MTSATARHDQRTLDLTGPTGLMGHWSLGSSAASVKGIAR